MALTNQQRIDVWVKAMREVSIRHETINVTKPELRDAIDAIDDWLEANAASLNTAIPQPARANLTNAQKAWLLSLIALLRFGG